MKSIIKLFKVFPTVPGAISLILASDTWLPVFEQSHKFSKPKATELTKNTVMYVSQGIKCK